MTDSPLATQPVILNLYQRYNFRGKLGKGILVVLIIAYFIAAPVFILSSGVGERIGLSLIILLMLLIPINVSLLRRNGTLKHKLSSAYIDAMFTWLTSMQAKVFFPFRQIRTRVRSVKTLSSDDREAVLAWLADVSDYVTQEHLEEGQKKMTTLTQAVPQVGQDTSAFMILLNHTDDLFENIEQIRHQAYQEARQRYMY